ncbi:uncharacterized protein LOC131674841 [Phymastichus coffea]|uniref:uncharacterized protein LOC131674841 n=1 Tax=Phymastichus coffea TaxID=108790 RepID=UPI00273A8419|nr:uncharacterized protein LOC131674841 [Phymastichus coffea]
MSKLRQLIRGAHTIARTINLAEPCSRPQKLVSADVSKPCPHAEALPTSCQPTRAVPVRICKRKDLERACQPKFCDCPQKAPPKTLKQVVCSWMVLGAKGALAAGLVYWTVAQGIWGDSHDSEEFYFRIRDSIATNPQLGEPTMPSLQFMKFKILDCYNHVVLTIIGGLAGGTLKMSKAMYDLLYPPCEPEEEDDKKKKKKK